MTASYNERLEHTRRMIIRRFGAAAGALIAAPLIGGRALGQQPSPTFSKNPFQLGIAAGDPAPDGFVIWTRLAPEPFQVGFGMPSSRIDVDWEVASDERFATIVQTGKTQASPFLAHSVHVEVTGLMPARPYWYRFRAGGVQSPTGRAKTAPALATNLANSKFGVAGCQSYPAGFFTAHKYLAAEDLDFVFCYGDYIYEGGGGGQAPAAALVATAPAAGAPAAAAPNPRAHFGGEIYSVDDYRRRYAQYKSDPDLQAAHAAHAWYTVWDDHETENNWASQWDENGTPPALFALRRQAAAQAYYEHMPLRASSMPNGPAIQIYRRAQYGTLMNLNFLDTRQFRSNQPCNDQSAGCTLEQVSTPTAQFMGQRQETWLGAGLDASKARWNVIAQQVMMMDLDRDPGPALRYNIDSWAGYRTPRNRVLARMQQHKTPNVIVLTGDEHVNYAGELHLDGRAPGVKPIGIEFVSTSVTSGGNGQDDPGGVNPLVGANAELKFINHQRGYLICDVTPERWQSEFKVLDKVTDRNGVLSTRKKFAVAAGSSRLTDA